MVDLTLAIQKLLSFTRDILLLLHNKLRFTAFGQTSSLILIIFAFLIFGFAINVFWKGAKS